MENGLEEENLKEYLLVKKPRNEKEQKEDKLHCGTIKIPCLKGLF